MATGVDLGPPVGCVGCTARAESHLRCCGGFTCWLRTTQGAFAAT